MGRKGMGEPGQARDGRRLTSGEIAEIYGDRVAQDLETQKKGLESSLTTLQVQWSNEADLDRKEKFREEMERVRAQLKEVHRKLKATVARFSDPVQNSQPVDPDDFEDWAEEAA